MHNKYLDKTSTKSTHQTVYIMQIQPLLKELKDNRWICGNDAAYYREDILVTYGTFFLVVREYHVQIWSIDILTYFENSET